MISSRKFFTLLALLLPFLISACSGSDQKKDATELLTQVENRYKSLDHFQLEAVIHSSIEAGQRHQSVDVPIKYTLVDPGKTRIEVTDSRMAMTLVSDGSTTWTYIPSMNKYTVKKASLLQNGDNAAATPDPNQNFRGIAEQLTKPFETITDEVKKAEITGEKTYSLDGKEVPVYVVSAVFKNGPQYQDSDATPTILLIAKDSKLVMKQEQKFNMESPQMGGKVHIEQTIEMKKAVLDGKIPDKTFTFNVPDNADKIDHFPTKENNGNSGMVGKPAKDFELTNLKGEKVRLSDLKGKVVLMDFWATWCAPCRKAHPHIQDLYDEYKDKGFVVLGINNESKQKARDYMQQEGYTFTTLLDTTNRVSMQYQVSAIPSVFIVGRDGKISSHLVGLRPESQIRDALKKAGL